MLFDTSAWIEFFEGTEKGRRVEAKLRSEETFTSVATISEIVNWCLKSNREDKVRPYLEAIKGGSKIMVLDEVAAMIAGKLNHERKKFVRNWGMLDSFVLATSMLHNLRILSKDSDFRDLPNAEIL